MAHQFKYKVLVENGKLDSVQRRELSYKLLFKYRSKIMSKEELNNMDKYMLASNISIIGFAGVIAF